MHSRMSGIKSSLRIVFLIAIAGGCSWAPEETASFTLPNGVEVKHSRTRIHPGLAEYNRELTLIYGDGRSTAIPLKMDTCGGYPMNVYLNKSGRSLRIRDALSEHFIDLNEDLNEAKGYSTVTSGDADYVGRFDDKGGRLHFVPVSKSPEIPIEAPPGFP